MDEEPVLVRADPAKDGFFMRLEVAGQARLDLGIRKGDAVELEEADLVVTDWDWTESMVLAETYVQAQAVVEVRVRQSAAEAQPEIAVTVDDIFPA